MAKIKEIAKKKTDGSYERVPLGVTKTSELNNDNGFITVDNEIFNEYPKYEELGAAAFSNKYKDLDGKPAEYTLPAATETSLGGVKPDNMTTKVMADGTMYVNIAAVAPLASTIAPGVVQPDGTTIKIDEEGIISASQAQHSPIPGTTTQIGAVKPDGTTLTIDIDGTMSAITATESTAGIVKPDGTSITIDADGTISAQIIDLGSPDTGLQTLKGTYTGNATSATKRLIDLGVEAKVIIIAIPGNQANTGRASLGGFSVLTTGDGFSWLSYETGDYADEYAGLPSWWEITNESSSCLSGTDLIVNRTFLNYQDSVFHYVALY